MAKTTRMNAWSDGLLRSMQFWMLWLGIGLPLLGALAGGFCAFLKLHADEEIQRRGAVAAAAQVESERQQRDKTVSQLREQLDQAGKQAAALELQKHRRITMEERAKFIAQLEFAAKGKVQVRINSGVDAETFAFANQLHEMVAVAGYDDGAAVEVGSGGQVPQGVFMTVGHEHHPFAGAIQQALAGIGIGATGLIDNSIPGDEVRIDVGTKP